MTNLLPHYVSLSLSTRGSLITVINQIGLPYPLPFYLSVGSPHQNGNQVTSLYLMNVFYSLSPSLKGLPQAVWFAADTTFMLVLQVGGWLDVGGPMSHLFSLCRPQNSQRCEVTTWQHYPTCAVRCAPGRSRPKSTWSCLGPAFSLGGTRQVSSFFPSFFH